MMEEKDKEENEKINDRDPVVVRIKAVVTGLFIVLFITFTFYSIAAYSIQSERTVVYRNTAYTSEGILEHYGLFSDESVYSNGTSAGYYPSAITRQISGIYRYSISKPFSGNYSMELAARYYVQSGKRKIYMKNESLWRKTGKITAGKFSVPVSIDLDAISSNISAVRRGLGLPRLSGEVYLLVKARPRGADEFIHRIYIMKDSSGLIYLKDPSKTSREVTYRTETFGNTMPFLTTKISVPAARRLFPALAVLSLIPLIVLYFPKKKEKRSIGIEGFEKYVVEVKDDTFMRIRIKSKEDLRKLLEVVDGPILHTVDGSEDVYSIISGNTIYEYRVPREKDA